MDIAVVIKCSDDHRIFRCIKSVPPNIEIICSITPNKYIENRLSELGIPYCITPKGNLSITINAGIQLTKANNIIIMDSDSYFAEGSIKALYQALQDNFIVKGRLIFLKGQTLSNRLVAELREYMNRGPVAYTPGLAFHKEIKDYIGYFFNPKVCWAEDAELTYRIKDAGIKLKIIEEAKIYHDVVPLTHDLRAAFRIGCGKRAIVEYTKKYNEEDVIRVLLNLFNGKAIKQWIAILKEKGLLVLCYYWLWNIFYYGGYYFIRFMKLFLKNIDKFYRHGII